MFERGSGASSRCRRHLAVAELEGADAPAAMSNRRCQLLAGFLALPQPWSSQCLAAKPFNHSNTLKLSSWMLTGRQLEVRDLGTACLVSACEENCTGTPFGFLSKSRGAIKTAKSTTEQGIHIDKTGSSARLAVYAE